MATFPIPTLDPTFSNNFIGHQWDFSLMWQDVINWYSASIPGGSTVFICSILLVIAGAVWIRTEDITIPGMIVTVTCGTLALSDVVPLPWQKFVVIVFAVLPVFAIIWHAYHER